MFGTSLVQYALTNLKSYMFGQSKIFDKAQPPQTEVTPSTACEKVLLVYCFNFNVLSSKLAGILIYK